MERRTGWIRLAVVLVLLALITACMDTGGTADDNSSGAGTESGGTKQLKVRFYDDPAGFDPASIFRIENENIAFNIFSGLTTYDSETGSIIPDLAESWETTDNKEWTFKLRQGVEWQKGYGELTAQDVLYSYNRILDPAIASPYAPEFANVESFEAPDDYTVVIRLKEPDGNFLHVVANYHQGQIVKKEAIEEAKDQVKWKPVGTGPYELESIDPNAQIVLKRHEGYYRGPAPIERIVFSIIKDEATATIALQNGEVDVLMRANRQENLDKLEQAGFKMNHVNNYAVSLRVFNLNHPILKEKKVRQAWAHAVDFQAIAESVSPSLQAGWHSMLMDWMDVYTEDIPRYEYDPEKAKRLLDEAGYPDGFTIRQLSTSATGVTDQMQLEQEYLKAVGINMEFELVDTPTYNTRRNAGEFEVAGRLLPAVNPDMILFSFLHPDNMSPKGLNGARYDNPDITAALEAARAEVDAAKRLAMYAEIQSTVMEELPYLPTFSSNVYWPSAAHVDGIVINKLAQVNFYQVDLTE